MTWRQLVLVGIILSLPGAGVAAQQAEQPRCHSLAPGTDTAATAIVRAGGSHWASGMVLGTLIGGVGGALLGAAVDEGSGYGPLVGVVVGASSGLLIGGVVGSTHSSERLDTLGGTSRADPPPDPSRCGPHVRVRRDAGWIEGTLLDASPEHVVVLPDDGQVPMTVEEGGRVERLAGTRGHALLGAAAGLVVGGVAGKALANTTKDKTGFVVAGFVGLGAIVGELMRTNRWEPMLPSPSPLRVGIVPRDGGVTLIVQSSF